MNSDENLQVETGSEGSSDIVFSVPEMAGLWPDIPRQARQKLLAAAGRQLSKLWQEGLELDTFPSAVWGWRAGSRQEPLSLPAGIVSRVGKPISEARLVRALSDWLHTPALPFSHRERLAALSAFGHERKMPRMARRKLASRVIRLSRRVAAINARELHLEILEETNHLCRQAVDCRGIWLPDIRRTADEFRHDIELALHSNDATHLKQSDVALVTRTILDGVDVVIKRHRFSKPGKRLKYLWRKSRARRAWAAGLTLQRLGLPVAEPLGFLEVTRKGRVTDNYIINRWLPGCQTAREMLEQTFATSARNERRRTISHWRRAWLDLIERGVYHADTKLSNALVQMNGSKPVIHWIDLECVQIGPLFTPYRILRNVVQMNGSLPRAFSLRDRLWFLRDLPSNLRWLKSRRCNRIIARWTSRRLGNEKRGVAGP